MIISFLAAFVSMLQLLSLGIVGNDGLGNCTLFAATHHNCHIAMFDNQAAQFCMIEGAGRHALVDSSSYDVDGND